MKSLLLISLALILLLILTAGCLDDLSSTLPPCCDGTCDGVKTSVIGMSAGYPIIESGVSYYTVDSDGLMYNWGSGVVWNPTTITKYYGHNVTFSYEMVNGHRHITGIIEDHDAKKPVGCCQCYSGYHRNYNGGCIGTREGERCCDCGCSL